MRVVHQLSAAVRSVSVDRLAVWIAMALGAYYAYQARWVCDDAFISFRYAENWVNGHGLIFNLGERVEGYTNLLWTLWIGIGRYLGVLASTWSVFWGTVAFCATIWVLGQFHRDLQRRQLNVRPMLPIAALLVPFHEDWARYATSGLETSLYILLATSGFVVLHRARGDSRRSAWAGLLFALASITRPDGVLFAACGGLFLLCFSRPWFKPCLGLSLGFMLLWLPVTLWRIHFYGDFFPNTYYAKSAHLSWFDQGWHYLRLYGEKYWPLLAGVVATILWLAPQIIARIHAKKPAANETLRVALYALFCVAVYTTYVAKVGGGFMYARLLLPTAPFLLILLEAVASALPRHRLHVSAIALLAIGYGLKTIDYPFFGTWGPRGIANEPLYYTDKRNHEVDEKARIIKRYTKGLPFRLAYFGGQARLVYKSHVPFAVECETGLTDAVIARKHIERRGRPGHEKNASFSYVVGRQKALMAVHQHANRILRIDDHIPYVSIRMGKLSGRLLYWDIPMIAALRQRGAQIENFPARLDTFIQHAARMPIDHLQREVDKLRTFYFLHVDDSLREQRLAALIAEKVSKEARSVQQIEHAATLTPKTVR